MAGAQVNAHQPPAVGVGRRPGEFAGSDDLFDLQRGGHVQSHAVDGLGPHVDLDLRLQPRFPFRDPQQTLQRRRGVAGHGHRLQRQRVRDRAELEGLIRPQAERAFLGGADRGQRVGHVGGDVRPRQARDAGRAQFQQRAAADRQAAFVQDGAVHRDRRRGELGRLVRGHDAAAGQVQRDPLAVHGFFEQRDVQPLEIVRRLEVPHADVVAQDFLHQVTGGDQDLEAVAAAAGEFEVQLPDQPQAVFLHVQHRFRGDGQAAIHLAFGHLGTPLQVQRPVGGQRGGNLLVVGRRLVFAAVGQTGQTDFGASGRHGQREPGRRGRRQLPGRDAPAAATFQVQADLQRELLAALARQVQHGEDRIRRRRSLDGLDWPAAVADPVAERAAAQAGSVAAEPACRRWWPT